MFSQDGTTVANFNQDQPASQVLAAPAGADADLQPQDRRLSHRGYSGNLSHRVRQMAKQMASSERGYPQGFYPPAGMPRVGEAEAAAAAPPAAAYFNPAVLPAQAQQATPDQVRRATAGAAQGGKQLHLTPPAPEASARGDALDHVTTPPRAAGANASGTQPQATACDDGLPPRRVTARVNGARPESRPLPRVPRFGI